MDLIREEEKLRFGAFTPGPPEVYEYVGQTAEVEAFSEDRDWMPRAVMMAKNALVWLDQLSRAYGREIRRLDQVPDEELDRLARAGFTALWLIGVWERSGASREIKRRMGNPEAEASAYSLFDYVIAAELGGQASLENLKGRAWRRGIRLASDMVPNHTGVDSRWMAEHPERFLSWPHAWPPFPSYTFNGPNISQTPGLGVYLEDHYWDRKDAAVVFKSVDFATGDARLIYHGNDGTHMPWNDTAQLDFLNPETREAVIQTILHVARMFPLIRFDAAMTLAKKHFQRLWYPEPGRGGDIASRAGNGLSRHDFDKAMPVEFWREVVDRVAREAPDTLLLAEAFWMLEGFFVRTLGMHRVYNSAFMHMLKSGGQRRLPPDHPQHPGVRSRGAEAVRQLHEQPRRADRHRAVRGRGQVLRRVHAHGDASRAADVRARAGGRAAGEIRDGVPPRVLERDAERGPGGPARAGDISAAPAAPHLSRAWTVSSCTTSSPRTARVNEDVFAYSNRRGEERGLVLYNNRFAEAQGWVRTSAAFAVKTRGGKKLVQKCLGEGLGLPNDPVVLRRVPRPRHGPAVHQRPAASSGRRGCTRSWAPTAARCSSISPSCATTTGGDGVGLAAEPRRTRRAEHGRGPPRAGAAPGPGVIPRAPGASHGAGGASYAAFLDAATPLFRPARTGRGRRSSSRSSPASPRRERMPAPQRALVRAWTLLRPLAGSRSGPSSLPCRAGCTSGCSPTSWAAGSRRRGGITR